MTVDAAIVVEGAGGVRKMVRLSDYLDAPAREASANKAIRWIKALRHARVDGMALRDRLRHRGDSLWWFVELYLHRMGAVTSWFEVAAATERLIDTETPSALTIDGPAASWHALVRDVATARSVACGRKTPRPTVSRSRLRLAWKGRLFTWAARASRLVPHRRTTTMNERARIAAFVHSAFWKTADESNGEEGYIGPVLAAVDRRTSADGVALVGLGPITNFKARRWWHAAVPSGSSRGPSSPVIPVEAFASRQDIAPSLAVWRERHRLFEALSNSSDLREHAHIDGHSIWPLFETELAGVTDLQLPWSARAMDEAGAALDRLAPDVAVTYAEAGGWGRALVLEARRRGIPSVGLQHGFIYRHWLNYLHDPDEMTASPANPGDAGFPAPDLTLVFDRYAERHLIEHGHFPPSSLHVTGSPRLDEVVARVESFSAADLSETRQRLGAAARDAIVLVATKHTQIGPAFEDVIRAAAAVPGIRLVVKCHPAETAEPYERDAAGAPHVTIAAAGDDLAALLAVASLVITVNSTVAIDGLVLGVPALVVALPNNLSPLVEAGAMTGASTRADIEAALRHLIDEPDARRRAVEARAGFLERYGISADGGAANRAADAILALSLEGADVRESRPIE